MRCVFARQAEIDVAARRTRIVPCWGYYHQLLSPLAPCMRSSFVITRDVPPDTPSHGATAAFLSNIDLTARGRIRFSFFLSVSLSLSLSLSSRSGNTPKSRLAERNEISSRIGAHVECRKNSRGRKVGPSASRGSGPALVAAGRRYYCLRSRVNR